MLVISKFIVILRTTFLLCLWKSFDAWIPCNDHSPPPTLAAFQILCIKSSFRTIRKSFCKFGTYLEQGNPIYFIRCKFLLFLKILLYNYDSFFLLRNLFFLLYPKIFKKSNSIKNSCLNTKINKQKRNASAFAITHNFLSIICNFKFHEDHSSITNRAWKMMSLSIRLLKMMLFLYLWCIWIPLSC